MSGFWSKDEILHAALASGHVELFVVALATVFLTGFYMARLFFVAFTGAPRSGSSGHESPAVMTAPLIILAVLAAGIGFIGAPWLPRDIHTFLEPSAARATGLDVPLLLESNGLAAAGILLAFLLYGLRLAKPESLRRAAGPAYILLARKFFIDELYMLLVRGLFFTTTTAIAWFDRHVVDGVVNLVGAVSKKGGDILRRTVTGRVQDYALVVFCGVVVALVVLFIASRGQILSFGSGR